MIRSLASLTRNSSNFLKCLNPNYVPVRTTIVVERENEVPLSKGKPPKELDEDTYIYKQVDNLAFNKRPPLKVIIVKDYPEKSLWAGMVCDLSRRAARNLIFYKNAVYASAENLEKHKELLEDRVNIEKAKRKKWLREYFTDRGYPADWADLPLSIRKTKAVLDNIQKMYIPVLDPNSHWKIDREAISYFFFSQHGIVVPTEAIEMSQDTLNNLGVHPITIVVNGRVRIPFELELAGLDRVVRYTDHDRSGQYILRGGQPLSSKLLAEQSPLLVPVSQSEVETGSWTLSEAHVVQALALQGLEVDEIAIQIPPEPAITKHGLYYVKIQYSELEGDTVDLQLQVCPPSTEDNVEPKVKRVVDVPIEPRILHSRTSKWTFEKEHLLELVKKQLIWDVTEESLEMEPEVINKVGHFSAHCKVNEFMRVKFDILVREAVADVPDDFKIEDLEPKPKRPIKKKRKK